MASPATVNKLSDICHDHIKLYCGIPESTTVKDAQIDFTLPTIINQIISYCRHDFECKTRTSETPFFPDTVTNKIFTNYRPITTMTSVIENSKTLVNGTDYYVNMTTGMLYRNDAKWDYTPGAIVLNYTGGVALSDAFEVVQVVYELTAIALGLKTRTYITGEGVEGAATINSLPESFLLLLERHKQCRV